MGASHNNLGKVLSNLADIYVVQGDFNKAGAILERALKIAQQHKDLETLAITHGKFAALCEKTGDVEGAESHLKQALDAIQGKKDKLEIQVIQALLLVLRRKAPDASVTQLFQRLLELRERVFGHEDASLKDVLEDYQRVLLALNQQSEADAVSVQINRLGKQSNG